MAAASSTTVIDENNMIGKCINGKYLVLKQIGQGGFGRVYLCENKYRSGQRYALKMIPLPKSGRHHHSVNPKAEIEIHRDLAKEKGRRFVKIDDDFELDGTVFIVMEYCEEGSLKDYVTKHRATMQILLATDVLLQLADALRLMHTKKIMHRDLTASNVLIKEISRGQHEDVKRLHVKITDFGLSKRDVQGQLRTMLGTPAFMAPEVRAGKYTMAADVFSLGSIFYLLLTRKYLPGANQMIMQQTVEAQQKRIGHRIQQQAQQQQQPYFDLEYIWQNVWEKNESVRALHPPMVHTWLKSFIVGLLCREDNRIMLNEIETCEYIKWYRLNRPVLDPEMEELCISTSLSGTPAIAAGAASISGGVVAAAACGGVAGAGGMRRLSRSGGGIVYGAGGGATAGGGVGAVFVGGGGGDLNNRDSALGSDNPSKSGSSRCRHPQVDQEGRCRTCSYRPTSSARTAATAAASLMDSGRPVAVASTRVLQPHSVRFESPLLGGTRTTMPLPLAPTVFSAPAGGTIKRNNTNTRGDNKENFVPSAPPAPPPTAKSATPAIMATTTTSARSVLWPLPSTVHLQNYVGTNEFGRCSFRRPSAATACTSSSPTTTTASSPRRSLMFCIVILEKTHSKLDQTIECVAELWRTGDGTAQELRLFDPRHRHSPCPSRNDPLVDKAKLLGRIRSADELAQNRMARTVYDTLCSFYKLAESKINQAYVEEIVDDRKWRLELRWNGYINVYEGPRAARELDLKLVVRQKAERGPFEEVKGADPLSRADRSRLDELASLLRTEVNKSVWRLRQFDSDLAGGAGGGHQQQPRNVRCTIYTRGYT